MTIAKGVAARRTGGVVGGGMAVEQTRWRRHSNRPRCRLRMILDQLMKQVKLPSLRHSSRSQPSFVFRRPKVAPCRDAFKQQLRSCTSSVVCCCQYPIHQPSITSHSPVLASEPLRRHLGCPTKQPPSQPRLSPRKLPILVHRAFQVALYVQITGQQLLSLKPILKTRV